jgi:N-acyl-D-amino-acid deacylase
MTQTSSSRQAEETSGAFDLLITGGTVIDGTKAPRYDADLGIRDGRIAAIGDLKGRAARETLDATDCIVAPGFIDCHTPDDQALLTSPDLVFKVSQGVTTVVTGNCGISLAPLRAGGPLPPPLNLLDAGARAPFDTFASFVQALRAAPASVNVVPLVGHSTLRVSAMSDLDRGATDGEIAAMRAMLQEALDAGAVGLSTGTFYPPAAAASTEEIIELARPLTGSGAVFTTHLRDEGDQVMAAMDEALRIGRELDVPVVLSHHKVQMPHNFGRSVATLEHVRQAMQHQCVHLDCYPYTAGSTMIRTDRGLIDGRVLIASSVPHPECAGRDLSDIAAEWGVPRDEAARRLQPGSAIYFMMDEGDVQRILAFEDTMIGSDGIPIGEMPHPRLWGTFPRVLGHYSRELNLFPLETAVWKMTGLTARNFGLADRGTLAVGRAADVVVFDPDTVIDNATYADPKRAAGGIEAVIVNGAVTWRKGAHCGARRGQVLLRTAPGAGAGGPAMLGA